MRPDAKQAVQVGGSAGLRPAPAEAVVPAAGRQPQQQQQKRAIRGMAGWFRLRGPLQVRPCKLGRRIHAAHAPATGPTPPSTVFRDLSEWHGPLLVGVDLGRHGRSTPCVDALRSIVEIFDFVGNSSTHGVDLPPSSGNCRRRGGMGLQDRWRHGWRHRAPMDGFTACPAAPYRPAQPTENPEPAVAVAFAVALALAVASAGAGCNPAAPLLR